MRSVRPTFSIHTYLVVFLIFTSFLTRSQNLVVNGSFEEFTSKPDDPNQLDRAIGWKGIRSPDYYVSGSPNREFGVPINIRGGYLLAQSGNAYAGFIGRNSDDNGEEHREYVQGSLTQPLLAGKQYCVFFYISLTATSKSSVRSIGLSFVNSNEKEVNGSTVLEEHISTQKTTRSSWQEVCGIYQAKGGENGFVIGYFLPSNTTYKSKYPFNYYFVDNVSVVEINNVKSCACNADERLLAKEAVVLENIHFETGKSELLPASYPALNKLYKVIAEHTTYVLTITGHTDIVGDEEKNEQLSLDRANAVATYLMKKGIASRRIVTKGLGSTTPIETNETEAGRKFNRRVEVQLKE